MKTVKVAEATNEQLNWLVARIESTASPTDMDSANILLYRTIATNAWMYNKRAIHYSTDWSQMGPIIEREGVHLFQPVDSHFKPLSQWVAALPYNSTSTLKRCSYGPTPLIAAARCYVVSKLGDTVEVPEELI